MVGLSTLLVAWLCECFGITIWHLSLPYCNISVQFISRWFYILVLVILCSFHSSSNNYIWFVNFCSSHLLTLVSFSVSTNLCPWSLLLVISVMACCSRTLFPGIFFSFYSLNLISCFLSWFLVHHVAANTVMALCCCGNCIFLVLFDFLVYSLLFCPWSSLGFAPFSDVIDYAALTLPVYLCWGVKYFVMVVFIMLYNYSEVICSYVVVTWLQYLCKCQDSAMRTYHQTSANAVLLC